LITFKFFSYVSIYVCEFFIDIFGGIMQGYLFGFLSGVANGITQRINSGIQIFTDGYKIITQKENFVLGELAERALKSDEGYASTYLGLPFAKLASFHVVTGDKYLKEAASFGEYDKKTLAKFDPQSRSLFEPLKEFLGDASIINMNGPEVTAERKAIKQYLSISNAAAVSREVFADIVNKWSSEKSINDQVCYGCTQVIATAWFNCKNIPEEIVPLLKKAEYYVFNRDKVTDADFQKLRGQLKALNDKYMKDHAAEILGTDNYLKHMYTARKSKNLEDLNGLLGLVVEGNITTVLTCAILQIATQPELQKALREELKGFDMNVLSSPEGYAKVRELKLLNNIYLEALRYFSPAPPLVRYASKTGKMGDKDIPARSYIFMPLRQIMHDPKKWGSPQVFDPARHEQSQVRVNNYPLTPFSTGPRVCPASFGFAEALFKIALLSIFKDQELRLTSHNQLEKIPVKTKEPRLKKDYFGELKSSFELKDDGEAIVHAYSNHQVTTELTAQQMQVPVYLTEEKKKTGLKC